MTFTINNTMLKQLSRTHPLLRAAVLDASREVFFEVLPPRTSRQITDDEGYFREVFLNIKDEVFPSDAYLTKLTLLEEILTRAVKAHNMGKNMRVAGHHPATGKNPLSKYYKEECIRFTLMEDTCE